MKYFFIGILFYFVLSDMFEIVWISKQHEIIDALHQQLIIVVEENMELKNEISDSNGRFDES